MEDPQIDRQKELELFVQGALDNKELPHLYFNGFTNVLGTGDILIVLKQNDQAVAVLNTSYTVAKTLVLKMGTIIANLEGQTGNTIMTTDDIAQKMLGGEPRD